MEFYIVKFKCHLTAQGGVSELCVTLLTPPKIVFYLLGGVARSIRGGLNGEGTPFILIMKDFYILKSIL